MPIDESRLTASFMRHKSGPRLWVIEVRDGSNCVYIEISAREAFNSADARYWSEQKNGERSRAAAEKWACAMAIEKAKVEFRTDNAKR